MAARKPTFKSSMLSQVMLKWHVFSLFPHLCFTPVFIRTMLSWTHVDHDIDFSRMNNDWIKAEILIIKGGGKSQFSNFQTACGFSFAMLWKRLNEPEVLG